MEKLYGTYQASGKGYGFLTLDDGSGADLFVPPRCDGGAWNGDRVEAVTGETTFDGQRNTATITSIIERCNRTVTGILEKRGRELWLLPSKDRLPNAIQVLGRQKGLHTGELVAVAVVSYGGHRAPPTGTLLEAFGASGSREAAVASILYSHNIDTDFPPAVLVAADATPKEVALSALTGRLDLRQDCIITIDGTTAKDLDDAISLSRDQEGHMVLGVHIADVSHYVKQSSPLDMEAWERGTSVYFANQVIPMLPRVLSNGICSLNPHVDRLALSCIMVLDAEGRVLSHDIQKSVICSTERMTYDDCNALLAGTNDTLATRYRTILPMLQEMSTLAGRLARSRRLRGALDLESQESYLICDAEGRPVDVAFRESGVSEHLIESFMLLANETVAKHLLTNSLPGVYRVHEKPSDDKVTALRAMLSPLGFELRAADHGSLQQVLTSSNGTPQAPAIHTMVLRSLMKARYDTECLGHFGLAADEYCHFTSPIRRYPDLMVHRILTMAITHTLEHASQMTTTAQQAAVQSSQRELEAMNAEREITRCYLAEFMQDKLGQTFQGTVSGVTKFGLFITLDNGVEGRLSPSALPDDRYVHDEVRMTLTGANGGLIYSFGMTLEVVVSSASPATGQIDLRLPGSTGPVVLEPRQRALPRVKKSKSSGHVPKWKRGREKR